MKNEKHVAALEEMLKELEGYIADRGQRPEVPKYRAAVKAAVKALRQAALYPRQINPR